MTSPRWHKTGLLIIVLLALVLVQGSAVMASPHGAAATRLTLTAPSQVELGSPLRLEARLRDSDGQNIAKAVLLFQSPASFLSGSGLMKIGEAITDEQGLAAIEYAPTRGGDMEVVVQYQGDGRYEPSQAATMTSVVGNHQLYHAEAGIRVPILNKWLLVAIMSGIWGTFFFVVLLVLRMALAPAE